MARKPIRWSTRCAALTVALLELPHEIAKGMTEKAINAMIELDHYPIRHADGGPDAHWNLRPLFNQDHKLKTKADAADMAKERKVRRAVDEHTQRMLLKGFGKKAAARMGYRWPSRPFPKRRRQ